MALELNHVRVATYWDRSAGQPREHDQSVANARNENGKKTSQQRETMTARVLDLKHLQPRQWNSLGFRTELAVLRLVSLRGPSPKHHLPPPHVLCLKIHHLYRQPNEFKVRIGDEKSAKPSRH